MNKNRRDPQMTIRTALMAWVVATRLLLVNTGWLTWGLTYDDATKNGGR